jgi:hypothetical protein
MVRKEIEMRLSARLAVAGALVLASGLWNTASAADRLFTAYNIWFEQPTRVYSTNYQRGNILPAGSEVKDVSNSSRKLEFVDVKSNMKFSIEFIAKHHPGLSEEQWKNRFLTSRQFSELTRGFGAAEIKSIKAGGAKIGMSKKAVLVSLGYPPEVGTASTELDTWKYWRHRFGTYTVTFSNGKVSNSGQ